jgi:hypothetical protein
LPRPLWFQPRLRPSAPRVNRCQTTDLTARRTHMRTPVKLAALARKGTGSGRRNRRRKFAPMFRVQARRTPGLMSSGTITITTARAAVVAFGWARKAQAPNPSRDSPNGRESPSRRRRSPPAAWTSFVDQESSACARLNRRTTGVARLRRPSVDGEKEPRRRNARRRRWLL